MLSCVQLSATSRTVACQAPLSMGILQARISECVAMPSSRGSSQLRNRPRSPALQGDSSLSEPPGKPKNTGVGSPGKNTGVGHHALLQRNFPTQESKRSPALQANSLPTELSVQFCSVTQSRPTLCDPMNRSMPGLLVHHQLPEFTSNSCPLSR